MSSEYIEILLLSLRAYVERMAAEIADPETRPRRRQQIRMELRPLYDRLRKMLEDNGG